MIKAGRYNIVAYQGATYDLNVTWSVDETPVDLTNYTAAMQVRQSVGATTAELSIDSDAGITLGGTAGTININISADTMGSAIPGDYVYDLELDSGGTVTRLLQGNFQIIGEVTK